MRSCRAGFVHIKIDPVGAPMRFGLDVECAFAFVSTLGIVRGLLHDLEADRAGAALDALRRTLTEHEAADGVTFDGSAWLITARVASGAV